MSDAIADVLQPGWAVQPLDHNPLNAATGGIWRVRRNATTAILKILWPGGTVSGRADWATSDDPGHWNYWRREGLAYRTGLVPRRSPPAGSGRPGCSTPSTVTTGRSHCGWRTSTARPARS
ncbi:hypothetical protein ACFQX7_14715 [Luedemannella flava]